MSYWGSYLMPRRGSYLGPGKPCLAGSWQGLPGSQNGFWAVPMVANTSCGLFYMGDPSSAPPHRLCLSLPRMAMGVGPVAFLRSVPAAFQDAPIANWKGL